jgi:PAS domain S-box-containing protein
MQDTEDDNVMAQLAAIVTSAHDAVIGEDSEGVITSWNHGAQTLFGFDSLEAIGKPSAILVPDELLVEEQDLLARVRSGQRVPRFDTVRRHQSRKLVDVSVLISPISDADGNIVGVSKIAHDITERKRIERKLALLSAIVKSSDDAIVSTDLDGVIDSWNPGAERMFGHAAAEAVGMNARMLIPAEHVDEEQPLRRVIEQGEHLDHYETVRQGKDGSHVEISLCLSPIRDSVNKIIGCSAIARDITRQKWFEAVEERSQAAKEKVETLNRREREVLEQVVAGNANKVIARKLSLSEKTIEKYRARVMSKLNARSVAELVRIALPAIA